MIHSKDMIATILFCIGEEVEAMPNKPDKEQADEIIGELKEAIRMIEEWAG